MVIFKFQKTSTAALAAHVDTLRAVTYLFRRAGFDVQYSQGYNPHMELGFSPPLPLGTESLCEYVSAKMPFSPCLTERLSPLCPPGLKFVKCAEGSVNLAAEIDGAGESAILWKVIFPQILPAMLALMVTNFVARWNDYTTSQIYLNEYPTLAYGIFLFQKESMYLEAGKGVYFASLLLTAIPGIIMYACFQGLIINNLSVGGIKG